MSKKVSSSVTCPYCGSTKYTTFDFGVYSLFCISCNKEFAIKLETKVTVKSAKIYDKKCGACDTYLHNHQLKDNACPRCGCDTLHENLDEVDGNEFFYPPTKEN